ncbi:MAG: hypothetical protein VKL59_21730 [Nostocaceae cyanobacterium]|nr:hypothetical protein [Nostocaceae cyanobacterium]
MLLISIGKKFVLASTVFLCLSLLGSSAANARTDNVGTVTPSGGKLVSLDIPPGQPVPTVKLMVYKDPVQGYNLEAKVTNFRFAPERVNSAPRAGEGHATLSLNGRTITRLYGSWYYLANLPTGNNQLTVTLNANNFEPLSNNGQVIADTVNVTVAAGSN